MPLNRSVLSALRGIVGASDVLVDDDVTERYRSDWTGRFVAPSATVVRPGSLEEVVAVIETCLAAEVAVVPQGGNTGLVGGSVPLSGEVVISVERLRGIESTNPTTGAVTALAGTPLAEVQRCAADLGWVYGVDLASRDSATVGGTIATNAGGLKVARNGDTRRQVVGVEMVAGTGEVVSAMSATLRDNTGYHLPSLLTGSEGTLGVITRARLRLIPRLRNRTSALLRFEDPTDAAHSAEALHSASAVVESVELFFDAGLELVCQTFGFAAPFESTHGGYVLVEAASDDDPNTALAGAVESLRGVCEVAVADDPVGRERLWRYRELHTEAIATIGPVHKLDVAVPPGSLADFVSAVPETVAAVAPGASTWLFGHGGESAVHVNVTGPSSGEYSVDQAVLELVAELGGSISAEHGIGRAKLPWIGLAHSPSDLEVLTRIKAAFDPAGIMNPEVLLPSQQPGAAP